MRVNRGNLFLFADERAKQCVFSTGASAMLTCDPPPEELLWWTGLQSWSLYLHLWAEGEGSVWHESISWSKHTRKRGNLTHIRCKSTVTILINSLITSSKGQQKLEPAQEATKLTSNNMDFIWWDYNSHGMTEHTHSHTYMHTSNFLLSPLPPSPPTCRHAIR